MRIINILVALLAIAFSTPANASLLSLITLTPPAKYNKMMPDFRVRVERLSMGDLQFTCNNNLAPLVLAYGCAKLTPGVRCNIYIPKTAVLNPGFPLPPIPVITPEMVLNHEMAHCLGWPANHPMK